MLQDLRRNPPCKAVHDTFVRPRALQVPSLYSLKQANDFLGSYWGTHSSPAGSINVFIELEMSLKLSSVVLHATEMAAVEAHGRSCNMNPRVLPRTTLRKQKESISRHW